MEEEKLVEHTPNEETQNTDKALFRKSYSALKMLNVRRLSSSRGALASLVSKPRSIVAIRKFQAASTPNFRPFSSLSDPGLNLFPAVPVQEEDVKISPTEIPPDVKDAQLRADIRAMGRVLGQVIQQYEGQGELEGKIMTAMR